VRANTEQAAKWIAKDDPKWLAAIRPRLLDLTDYANAASALGEIRAYGALIETWMNITPAPVVAQSNVSPEFEVQYGDGPVIVEVHARQLDRKQVVAQAASVLEADGKHVQAVADARAAGRSGNVVTTHVSEIFPYGEPEAGKAGDTVDTNAISRVASVKGKEHQIDLAKPFVLWLDLQDQAVFGLPVDNVHFSPSYSASEGEVHPGNFWWALYGRKGELLPVSRMYSYRSMPMAHEGRFFQTINGGPSRVSAYVFSLPRATVLMENPNAPVPLTPRFRAGMLKAPFFRLDLSVIDWQAGTAASTINAQRQAHLSAMTALAGFES
jgi:hypothetical protein